MYSRRSTHSGISLARVAHRGRRAKAGRPMTHAQAGPARFEVQYWSGGAWVTLPGAVTVNGDKVLLNLAASGLAARRVRLLVHDAARGRSHAIELASK